MVSHIDPFKHIFGEVIFRNISKSSLVKFEIFIDTIKSQSHLEISVKLSC